MSLPTILVGASLGQTIYRCVVALLIALAVCWSLWSLGSRAYHAWWADYWKGEAIEARDNALRAEANATSANAGAANASTTRARIDSGTGTVRAATDQSATRIENHADLPVPATDRHPVAAHVMRELAEGETRIRAAEDRLQRPHPD
ncbi:MAG: hypothetical protein ACREPV_01240 [Lysobacter sp.]